LDLNVPRVFLAFAVTGLLCKGRGLQKQPLKGRIQNFQKSMTDEKTVYAALAAIQARPMPIQSGVIIRSGAQG
jgi:hypothetical protein